MIFPLALTLTAFLMWIIISLNGQSFLRGHWYPKSDEITGTILHLQTRKQNYKLQKFQRLWRILIVSVIAVAVFFVVSSMSLSNRLDEGARSPSEWSTKADKGQTTHRITGGTAGSCLMGV